MKCKQNITDGYNNKEKTTNTITENQNNLTKKKKQPPNSYHLEGGLMSGKVNELSREMKETIK